MLQPPASEKDWVVPDLERPAHPKAENFFKAAYVGRSTMRSARSARSSSHLPIKCYRPNRANFVRTGRGRFNEELAGNQWETKSNASRQGTASVASRSYRHLPAREEGPRAAEEVVSAKKRTLAEAKRRDLELHEPKREVENPEEEGEEFERAPEPEMVKDSKSVRTTKSYVDSLREEIEKEREVRKDLEKQVEELKRLSSEISSHLGLATPKA